MVPWYPSVVGVKGAVGHTSTGGGDTGHMWLAAPCLFCQLFTVGGAEWQVIAWASLSGQDDHSLPCSSQTSLCGLPPRLEGLSAWPGLAMNTWLCLAGPVPGVLPCSLVYCVCSKCVQQPGRLMPPPAGGMEDLPTRSQDATASHGPRPVNTTMGTSLGLPRATSVAMCQPSAHSSKAGCAGTPGPPFPMGHLLCSLADQVFEL